MRTVRFTYLALAFELLLAAVAVVGGWLTGQSPWIGVAIDKGSIVPLLLASGVGVLATAPMVALLYLLHRATSRSLRRLREVIDDRVVPLFQGGSLVEFALISVAAGVGEELLFRGFLQAGIEGWLGSPLGTLGGLAVASVLFGVCHWVNGTYALLAALVGGYLGVLLIATGHLAAPIVAHALYDFIALVYLVRFRHEAPGADHSQLG